MIMKLSIENGGEIDDALRVDNLMAMESDDQKAERGRRLRRVRTEIRDLSQDQLAERSGVAKAQISNCETGNRGLGYRAIELGPVLHIFHHRLLAVQQPLGAHAERASHGKQGSCGGSSQTRSSTMRWRLSSTRGSSGAAISSCR